MDSIGSVASDLHDEVVNTPSATNPAVAHPVDPAIPPDLPGPHGVGFTEGTLVYTPKHLGGTRRLRLLRWYPVDANYDGPKGMEDLFGTVRRPEVFVDAPMLDAERFPLLVFSHGSRAIADQSMTLAEHFASHGFVVAAVDHDGDTVFEVSQGLNYEAIYHRPVDLHKLVDRMLALPPDDPMSTAQFGPIVVAGHSLGGTTAMVVSGAALDPLGFGCPDPDLSLCQRGVRASLEEGFRDPRIALCLAITPAGHPALLEHDAPLTQLEIPVLLVRAGSDGVLPPPQHTDAMWEVLRPREDVLMLNFEEAGHYSFADICAFNPKAAEAIEQFWNDGCSPEFPPAAEIESTTWAAMLAFTFEHLYGSEEARSWLSEPSSLLPHGVIAE